MRPQRIEPYSILIFRRVYIIISLLLLIVSIAVLFASLAKETPVISTTFVPTDNPIVPAVHLGFAYNFNISCWIYLNYRGTKAKSCNEYVNQPKNIGYEEYTYVGKFSPRGEINLTRYDDIGPYFVFLRINVIDPLPTTFNDSAQDSAFRMTAYDSENEYDTQNKAFDDSLVTPFEESLFYINKYTLTERLIYKFGFTRVIRKLTTSQFLSFNGLPGLYVAKPYIESYIQDIPMSASSTDYVTIRISPGDFNVKEEQEQRDDT